MRWDEMVADDWGRVLADCGEEVVYRVMTRTWDETFREGEETGEDVAVRGLVGNGGDRQDRETAGQSIAAGRDVVVRLEDLPEDCPQLTDRLLIAGVEYDINGFSVQPRGGLVQLRGSRRTGSG